jgi:hypothetical protein
MHFAQCFAAFMACDGMERRDLGMHFGAYQLHSDRLYVATQETLWLGFMKFYTGAFH